MPGTVEASREIQVKKKSVFVPFSYRVLTIKLSSESLCIWNDINEKLLSIDAQDAKSKIAFQSTWSHYNTIFRGPSKTVRVLLDDEDLDILRVWIREPGNVFRTGECELCGMDTYREYSFYFGKMLDTTVRGTSIGMETIERFTYEQFPMCVWICDKCLYKHSAKGNVKKGLYAVGILYIALVLIWLIFLLGVGVKGIRLLLSVIVFCAVWAGAFGLILGLAVLVARTRKPNKKDIGDRMAIRLRKADLEGRGYDLFWTSRDKPEGGELIPTLKAEE